VASVNPPEPPHLSSEGKAAADGSYAGFIIVTVSATKDEKAGKSERVFLGFTLDKTASTSWCQETSATPSGNSEAYTFRMDSKMQTSTHVIASSTVVLVLEATGSDEIALRVWACQQGFVSNFTYQGYKIIPAPSVILSFVIPGAQSVKDITKELEAKIVKTFAKVLAVPPQSVSLLLDQRRQLQDETTSGHDQAMVLVNDRSRSLRTKSEVEGVNRSVNVQGSPEKKMAQHSGQGRHRRSGGVTLKIRILSTSQEHAEALASQATKTLLDALLRSLAESGIQIDASSISAAVVQPVLSASYGLGTETRNSLDKVAIIAGSVSGGVFVILVALSLFVFQRYRRKPQSEYQPSKAHMDDQFLGAGALGVSVPVPAEQHVQIGNQNNNRAEQPATIVHHLHSLGWAEGQMNTSEAVRQQQLKDTSSLVSHMHSIIRHQAREEKVQPPAASHSASLEEGKKSEAKDDLHLSDIDSDLESELLGVDVEEQTETVLPGSVHS
jgi:hypothetical protein